MKKKMSMVLTVVLMAVTLGTICPVQAHAAQTDVTKNMAANRNIRKLSKMITAYTTAMNLSNYSTTKPVKVKMNNDDKLSIAAFVRYNFKNDYSYTAAELRSETKNLFGKSATVKKIKKDKTKMMMVCNADRRFVKKDAYMYCGGDFADVIPAWKITKVVQTGKNTYTVTIQNRIGYYGEKGTTAIGTTTLKVKKASASKYGYVIRGLGYQYNGNAF